MESMVDEEGIQPFPDMEFPPQRVVSLVPSITESLFELGLGRSVVGITDYCTRPAQQIQTLPKVGGIRDPRLPDILALQPDLVIVNREENLREIVNQIENQGIRVWITFPRSVVQCIEMLWAIAGMFQSESARRKVQAIQTALDWQISASETLEPISYFCPLWQEEARGGICWWMTCNEDTYTSNLLKILGGKNIFSKRQRLYPVEANLGFEKPEDPAGRDTRYPIVTQTDIIQAAPEVILLPDEPYHYQPEDIGELSQLIQETPAGKRGAIRIVDGSLITWYGTRLAHALDELSSLFSS